MRNTSRFASSLAFIDLLFNLLVGFVFLFMVAFVLINPVAKDQDIPSKAEFIIILEWDADINDDLDLWVRDPQGNVVSFRGKDSGIMNLERDDIGWKNDTYISSDGTEKRVETNSEVVTLRGSMQGEYNITMHLFSLRQAYKGTDGEISYEVDLARVSQLRKAKLTIVKVNPYRVVYKDSIEYSLIGAEMPLVNFTIDSNGNFVEFNNIPVQFVVRAVQ